MGTGSMMYGGMWGTSWMGGIWGPILFAILGVALVVWVFRQKGK